MILNRQKKIRLSERSLRRFLDQVLRQTRLSGAEVSIAFVTDREIARWNEKYRKKTGPTDVLSFPACSMRDVRRYQRSVTSSLSLGDIAIAPETARRYARKNGRTLDVELRVLMLHGVLHLMGYDHQRAGDRGKMNRLENRLRRRLAIA